MWIALAAVAAFFVGIWLTRLTKSDTWEIVQDLRRRVEELEQAR